MMILAIDSSNSIFSAAIHTKNGMIYQQSNHIPHANIALPIIKSVLAEANCTLSDLDAFAFSAGPGGFSALRLTCAISRSFAYALRKPLLAVPSFAALAYGNYGNQDIRVKCAMRAHRDHVYFGVCKKEEGIWTQTNLAVLKIGHVSPRPKILHACGEGFIHYPVLLGDAYLNDNLLFPDARVVCMVAEEMYQAQLFSNPLHCEPIYARKKIALTIRERQKIVKNK